MCRCGAVGGLRSLRALLASHTAVVGLVLGLFEGLGLTSAVKYQHPTRLSVRDSRFATCSWDTGLIDDHYAWLGHNQGTITDQITVIGDAWNTPMRHTSVTHKTVVQLSIIQRPHPGVTFLSQNLGDTVLSHNLGDTVLSHNLGDTVLSHNLGNTFRSHNLHHDVRTSNMNN